MSSAHAWVPLVDGARIRYEDGREGIVQGSCTTLAGVALRVEMEDGSVEHVFESDQWLLCGCTWSAV